MPSTPNTSSSSEDLNHRGRGRKPQRQNAHRSTPSKLPSPFSDTHEDANEVIERAYRAIWNSFCGLAANENPSFDLGDQQNYEHLYERLAEHKGLKEYFEEEIRKDWCGGKLTLHFKASPLHDSFKELDSDAINTELNWIANAFPDLRPFRSKMISGGTARIQKKRKRNSRARAPDFDKSPDGQWHYSGVRYPPFILEVAYSQDQESLVDKVTQVFEHLPGGICSILGFDITYAGKAERMGSHAPHAASLSLWTSHLEDKMLRVQKTINQQAFRTTQATRMPGDLVLPFKLFMPFKARIRLPADLGPNSNVRISFARLCDLVSEAEQRQNTIEATASPSPSPRSSAHTIKRVMFEDENGLVTRDTEVFPEPKRRSVGEGTRLTLGRTRSQTRSASQPRRSSRVRTTREEGEG